MVKLTKELLDSVRNIDGFPIGEDEDLITISDPPYYTACPNPFIEDFIKENGTPYNQEKDNYVIEPFSSDVSEGKSDIVYKSHSYHTQSPFRALTKYILHYTSPGDIIFDGFCGTGMTGFAAQACGSSDIKFRNELEKEIGEVQWGPRKAILCDLSPLATFMSYNYNKNTSYREIENQVKKIIKELETDCLWVYKTTHPQKDKKNVTLFGDKESKKGIINYIVWSEVFTCPDCMAEFSYYEVVIDKKTKETKKQFNCPKCNKSLKRRDLERSYELIYDHKLSRAINTIKHTPVLIYYKIDGSRTNLVKVPDEDDLEVINKIKEMDIETWYPINEFYKGVKTQEPLNININYAYQVYTKRNLFVLSKLYDLIKIHGSNALLGGFISSLPRASKRNRYIPKYGNRHVGTLPNALYFPPLFEENNIINAMKYRFNRIISLYKNYKSLNEENVCITTQSSTSIKMIPDNTIDYIFTDPPFGQNIMYSELNYIRESWIKVITNNDNEAIINKVQKKGLPEYQQIMETCFKENYRILKPGRWTTVEFHNTSNKVWVSIQEALMRAGFVIADVRVLDKKKGTINQLSYSTGTVKQDLIISAYKPSYELSQQISYNVDANVVWIFIGEHLSKLPVYLQKQDITEVIIERQNYLLFDRLVSFFIQRGMALPLSASEFYDGLKQRFPERDGMYFLQDQVSEYDSKRINSNKLEQSFLTVHDEKSAVQWLRRLLELRPMTYQAIQPEFLQSLYQSKHEDLPELKVILDLNFIKNEKDEWKVPDFSADKDLEKIRIRSLLNEFREYKERKGGLRVFRSEAIRVGFSEAWKNGDYDEIISIAEKIPTAVLHEDSTLLMYYDNALARKD
jgi:DNA modification methylase